MIFETLTTANNAVERITLVMDSIHSSLEQCVILAGTADTIFQSVTPYANTAIVGMVFDSEIAFSSQLGTFINAVGIIDSNTAVTSSLASEVMSNYGSYTFNEMTSINNDFNTIVTTINSYDEQVAQITVSAIDDSINSILPPLSKTVRIIPAVNSPIVARVVANTSISSGVSVIVDGVRNEDSIVEISSNFGQQSIYNAVASTRNVLSNPIVSSGTVSGLLSTLNNAVQSLKGKV